MMDNMKMQLALELASANVRSHSEPLRSDNLELLRRISLAEEAQQFFAEFSFNDGMEIGAFVYHQANCFKKNNEWEEDFQRALQTELLLVGSAANGDLVALDLQDYQTGIIFHEHFWDIEEEDPRKYLIKLDCSLGQFFYNSVTVEGYPADAYEAAAYTGAEFTGYAEDE